jgi:hypothetical protein
LLASLYPGPANRRASHPLFPPLLALLRLSSLIFALQL